MRGKDLNRVLDLLLGNNGSQRLWIGFDGNRIDPITGAAIASGAYSDVVQNTAGKHTSVRKVAGTTDTPGSQAFAVDDTYITIGVEERFYNAAGSNQANLKHSGTNDFLKTDGGLWIAKALGVGTDPTALSDGYLLLSGNPRWLSGGAKFIELDHAATADRIVTFQDLAGTVCLLGVANAGGNLIFTDATYDIGAAGATRPRDLFLSRDATVGRNIVVTGTVSLSGATGAATDLAHGGAAPAWGPLAAADIPAGLTMRPLYDTVLSGTAASFDVTSIPATYRALKIQLIGRSDTAAASATCLLRLNNDSAGNYDYQNLQANNATVAGAGTVAATSIFLGSVNGATCTAGLFAQVDAEIADYTNTTPNKTVNAKTALKFSTGAPVAGDLIEYTVAGFWRSTAAINRITLTPGAGNWIAGTRLVIWGLPIL